MNWLINRNLQVIAEQAILSGTNFLLTILIARHLDVSAFGVYAAYILVTYLVTSVTLAWSLQVFQVAKDKSPSYVSFVFWWQVFILTISMILLTGINYIYNLTNDYFLFLFGFGFVMFGFGRKLLLALNKVLPALFLGITTSGLLILSFIFFQQKDSKDTNGLLAYFALAYAISLVIILLVIKPFHAQTSSWLHYANIHLKKGKWLFFTAVSQWLAGNLFVVASGIYLGTIALGALRLAQSLFGALNILLQAFENYVLPKTAEKMNQSFSLGIAYIRAMNYRLGWIFLPILALIFLFAKPIFASAGSAAYAEYAFVLQGISLLYVTIFLSQPLRFVFRSLQLNQHFFYAYLISLGFALTTSHWLLSDFGLQGVIAGLISSQVILMAYWSFILHRKNISKA